MNKTTISSLIIVAVVAGLVIWWAATPKKPGTDTATPQTEQSGTSTEDVSAAGGTMEAGKKMPFSEFAKQGGSYQCTVDQYIDAGMTQSTKGTIYLSNGMIRGNYTTTVSGVTIDSSVIVRDHTAYTWSSMSSIGYKAPVVDTVGGDASVGTSGEYSWNAQQIGDYDCKAWTADASQFTIPKNITFQTVLKN